MGRERQARIGGWKGIEESNKNSSKWAFYAEIIKHSGLLSKSSFVSKVFPYNYFA
jgi:hypothetical protein